MEELLSKLPNHTYKKGKEGFTVPSISLSYDLVDIKKLYMLINEKETIAKEHGIKGVGFSYTELEFYVTIPIYGNDTKNNIENIVIAFSK